MLRPYSRNSIVQKFMLFLSCINVFWAVPSIWNMRVVAFFKIDLPYERISDLYYGKEKTKKYVSVPKLVKRNRPSWFGLLSCLGKCIQGGSLGNKITVRFQTTNMTSSCSLLTNKESEKNLSSEQPPHIYGKKLIFFCSFWCQQPKGGVLRYCQLSQVIRVGVQNVYCLIAD